MGAPDDEAARFLGQAALGATPEGVQEVLTVGRKAWLQAQMAMPPSGRLYDVAAARGLTTIDYQDTDTGLDNALW